MTQETCTPQRFLGSDSRIFLKSLQSGQADRPDSVGRLSGTGSHRLCRDGVIYWVFPSGRLTLVPGGPGGWEGVLQRWRFDSVVERVNVGNSTKLLHVPLFVFVTLFTKLTNL